MQINVTVTRNGVKLFSNIYNASVEGDVEKAASYAHAERTGSTVNSADKLRMRKPKGC
ncbi:MAG TPA: hypothetical protein VJU59_23190 [Paraburkholderia sp.]|uniref:hypothetical protein n=1 Tax=Paraburkholderia sp. TaxID=1926495 RepID=UPI002B488EF0|nr:hypothetical protein [Paraburkholderia sp.]HKR42539.1 hypothetical protein [Paraburkholderia sp.]